MRLNWNSPHPNPLPQGEREPKKYLSPCGRGLNAKRSGRGGIFLAVVLLFLSAPALATDKGDLDAAQTQVRKTAAEEKDARRRLDSLRRELVTVTREVQARERALLALQEKQATTDAEIGKADADLKKQRRSLARMIVALQRLDRLPPQALLARPSAPIDTARSYTLLQEVLPELSARAQQVRETLDRLAVLREAQTQQAEKLRREKERLDGDRAALEKAVKERMALLKKAGRAHESAARRAAALAREAGSLRDLVTGLGGKEKPDSVKDSLFSWFGRSGGQMPVVGVVETGYGDRLEGGGTSQGLRIRASDGAVVVAPHAGTVKFAGPFRQYRLLVILQHDNGEHSLLGGLDELYTRIGERVSAGEPLGRLEGKLSGDSTRTASLYYERRQRGKPVDPRRAKN